MGLWNATRGVGLGLGVRAVHAEERQEAWGVVRAPAGWRTGVGTGWNFSLKCFHVLSEIGSKVISWEGGWMRKYYSIWGLRGEDIKWASRGRKKVLKRWTKMARRAKGPGGSSKRIEPSSFSLLCQDDLPCISTKVTNIPLYKHTSICLSIDLLLNVNIVSSVGLLWIQLLWTFFVQVFIGTYVFISPG